MIPPPPGSETPSSTEDFSHVPPPLGEEHVNDVLKRKKKFSWKDFGGDGFLVSVTFHALLALIALFYIVSRYREPKKTTEPEVFATGAGGGRNGDRAKIFDRPKTTRQVNVKMPARITSKGASSITLPDAPQTATASFASGLTSGGLSSGSGGGSGGGAGTGLGIGKGGGNNFVGRFLGGRLSAKRVAVYMDASPSMRSYLKRVEEEAKKAFPQADVFRYSGIRVCVEDGEVVGGNEYRGNFKKHPWPTGGASNNPADFTETGKEFLGKANRAMTEGSVGAWFDRILTEKYDALIIFSDFQDGFVQFDKEGRLLMKQTPGHGMDVRKGRSKMKEWENRWYRECEKAGDRGGPRVYCYSIDANPQPIWKKCAKLSGGAVKLVEWMRDKDGKPPEGEGLDEAAGKVNKRPGAPKPR